MGVMSEAMKKTPTEMYMLMALALGGVAYGTHVYTKKALSSPNHQIRHMAQNPEGYAKDKMKDLTGRGGQ
ncbi:hypothetical protein HDU97_009341 [Phlyctochytrium planicorne]|nr:hypothetical protein HDU97_009341 [Phlyctochytrium planicorne]